MLHALSPARGRKPEACLRVLQRLRAVHRLARQFFILYLSFSSSFSRARNLTINKSRETTLDGRIGHVAPYVF